MPKYKLTIDLLSNDFPELARKMPQKAATIQERAMLELVDAADPLTPVGVTGNLKNNKEIGPDFVHWLSSYTGYVHFGTRYMAARPFIDEAVAQVRPQFEKAMKELLKP